MAISVYNNLTQNKVTKRRKEALAEYTRLILWGRKHPVSFIEKIFKIKLMDYQAYVIESTWTATSVAWVMSRNAGKSFIGALYIMTRAVLFPQMKIRLLAGVSRQSQELFTKLEDIAKKNISSLIGSSDVFINEMVKSKADSDGFLHDSNKGWSLELYNGSIVSTVKGTEKTAVSLRSNLNFYDEAGGINDDFFSVTEPFAAQEKGFKTGVGLDINLLPQDIPNQIIYASSASDTESYLWKKYKENAKKMLMGIPGYFVADISCEMPLHPTIDGVEWTPLLTQAKIDDDMRANEPKAIREYYNKFSRSNGVNAAFRRSDIVKFSQDYFPAQRSEGKDKKYIIAFDPALQSDNSIILVMEMTTDKKTGKSTGRIVNVKNLIEVFPDGSKRQMRTPDQLKALRQTILDYNGDAAPYENIMLLVDGGAGGQGRGYCEYLWSDFQDEYGNIWPGLIDLTDEDSNAQSAKYPDAIDCVRILEPRKLRQEMFKAASEATKEGIITFPMETPHQKTIKIDDKEYTLGEDDLQSYLQMDLLKEELVAIVKSETASGNITYKLAVEKERSLHDDRAYTYVMATWYIFEKNRALLMDKGERSSGLEESYSRKRQMGSFGARKKQPTNPFGHIDKPFDGLKIR